ncbi:MAG: hypothetical protein WD872_08375 [Pirellulaceae bacterium]
MSTRRPAPFARLGCGVLLLAVLFSSVLLVLNGLIVTNLFTASAASLPPVLREPRWAQAILFLGPVFLLVVQWWAYDVAIDWLRPRQPRDPARRGKQG